MASYVTPQQASDHLRAGITFSGSPAESDDPRAADLLLKLDTAEYLFLDYIKHSADSPPWEPTEQDQYVVKACILLILSGLYDDREGSGGGDYLKDNGAVANLARRLRDPALA
jgi:hypothetical protein